MPISNDLQQQLAPALAELEQSRQAANASAKKGTFSIIAVLLLGGVLVFSLIGGAEQHFAGIITAVISVATSAALYHFLINKPRKQFCIDYKYKVFTKVVADAFPGMHYHPERGIPEHQFKNSGLISSRIDRYHSEDLFEGTLGSTDIAFSEVKAERKEKTTDSNGKSSTKWVTIFDGIYLEADFHKHFSTRVTVTPDVAERLFGWLGKKMQSISGNTVHLENPEFEKHFVVRGADPIETRYILTPAMQERILELRHKFGASIMLSFQYSKLILLFKCNKNWFEPDHKSQGADLQQIQDFVSELKTLTSVVEDLDLNTRIWTKE